MTDKILTIDGRNFHGVTQELSAAQDYYLTGHLRLAGVLNALLKVKGDEDRETRAAADILALIMASGRGPRVLAGCLTEVGKPWTYEEAERNAAGFAAVTNPQDKEAMREAIIGLILGFFLYANRSVQTSRKSSSQS